jgi:hypothetical protein
LLPSAVNLLDAGPSQTPGTPYITIFPPRGKNTTIIQHVKPFFFEKGRHTYNVPDLAEYDFFLVAFSGGKDSTAAFLYLLDRGVAPERIELWHHSVDGHGGNGASSSLMDWPSTPAYCRAFARAFHAPLYFSRRLGGFEREMLRDGTATAPISWENPDGSAGTAGGKGPKGTRLKFPQARPRVISDRGPQFIAKDFKEFIRVSGMTHVKTSPYYPQSNGKIERWHQSVKKECIRPKTPLSLEDARRLVGEYVAHYNNERLHSAIGYVTPNDKLNSKEKQIWEERDRKLDEAREIRRARRMATGGQIVDNFKPYVKLRLSGETEAGSAGEQLAEG